MEGLIMPTCLVTGGAGFIGSHLVEALVGRSHAVRVLDNLSTGSLANLEEVAEQVELLDGDITDLATVRRAMRDVEVVFHQAALPSVPRSIADPLATHQVCVNGTLNVLLAARDEGVRRVVYAASSSAYGNPPRDPSAYNEVRPKRESDPTLPLSPYAVSKLAGEQYCAAFSQVYDLETVRLRYFNVFGPRQLPDSPYAAVIPRFIDALTSGRRPVILGDGEQSRDFTFVEDVVRANLLAADAPGVNGRLYNIACGRRTSLLHLVAMLNQLLGTRITPVHGEARVGDVRHSLADIECARRDLGYQPSVDMLMGVRRCLDWWRQRRGAIPMKQPAPLAATLVRH
jgi:UDP-glucose 4-epimerase